MTHALNIYAMLYNQSRPRTECLKQLIVLQAQGIEATRSHGVCDEPTTDDEPQYSHRAFIIMIIHMYSDEPALTQ